MPYHQYGIDYRFGQRYGVMIRYWEPLRLGGPRGYLRRPKSQRRFTACAAAFCWRSCSCRCCRCFCALSSLFNSVAFVFHDVTGGNRSRRSSPKFARAMADCSRPRIVETVCRARCFCFGMNETGSKSCSESSSTWGHDAVHCMLELLQTVQHSP